MYKEEYKRWLEADLVDCDLNKELQDIADDDEAISREVEKDGMPFKRKGIFNFMISYICPIFLTIILISSIASVFGFISI